MRRMSPAFLSLASRLLAIQGTEAGQTNPSGAVEAAEKAFRMLDGRLAKLLGPEGFDSLLRRAVHLAASEHSFLENVTVEVSPSTSNGPRHAPTAHLKGLLEATQGLDQSEVRAGLDVLLGYFVWLLSTFIGEDLTLRQLRRIWPEVSLESAGERGESGPEEAKP